MQVETTHHIDASEPDANGMYDYYYEYDITVFSDGDEAVVVRAYTGSPQQASFLKIAIGGVTRHLAKDDFDRPLMRSAIAYLRSNGKTNLQWLGGGPDGYGPIT